MRQLPTIRRGSGPLAAEPDGRAPTADDLVHLRHALDEIGEQLIVHRVRQGVVLLISQTSQS
jgi:hypothetical protein